MRRELIVTALCAMFLTMLVLSPVLWMARRAMPPAVAAVDLQALIEEEQKRVVEVLAKAGAGADQRGALEKRSADFAKRLSNGVDAVGADCRCVLVNKAALLGGAAADVTEQVRERMKR